MLKPKIIISLSILMLFSSLMQLQAQAEQKILIAYFTWADNTVILDRAKAIRDANGHVFSMENSSGVDTVTTASVLPPGNTGQLAEWIQQTAGGDIFSIQVQDKYSCYWDEILDRAADEKADRARPVLTSKVRSLSDYDVVFLGFPTWWYTIPMAVASFVEENDLSGKTVIPFVAHGTSGVARTIRDLKKLLPSSAELEKEKGFYRSQINVSRPELEKWLRGMGYTK